MDNTKKTSDAQVRASRNWEKKNPERARKISYRSSARTFIKKWADLEDLEELKMLISQKEKELKNL